LRISFEDVLDVFPALVRIQPNLGTSVFDSPKAARVDRQIDAGAQRIGKQSRLIESALLFPAFAQRNWNNYFRFPTFPFVQFLQPASHNRGQLAVGMILEM
jgi:hypothetical protein